MEFNAFRNGSSSNALAPMNAIPLEPALILNTGITGPESIFAGPFHEAGHSCA